MTNQEIRAAVLRIVQIKAWKEEEKVLRESIIKEMKRRRKEKLDLGGPNKEDYVCLRTNRVEEINPKTLLRYLEDKSEDAGWRPEHAHRIFCECVRVVQRKMDDTIGTNETNHLKEQLPKLFRYNQEQLTYKISMDDKNQVRGIDL